jgi:hypothetical protein
MTDIVKALAFATHCLKWHNHIFLGIRVVEDVDVPYRSFDPNNASELQAVVQEFLGNRYYIQMNRGTSSTFHWRVIVGWQNGTDKSKSTEQAVGVGEDLWDAMFDACVQAEQLFRPGPP